MFFLCLITRRGLPVLGLATLVVLACSCDIADEDRCPDGFTYNPEMFSCELIGEDDTDTGTGSDPTDGGPDGSSGDGWGEACTQQSECADYEVDYCLVSPFSSDGYCSLLNCSPGDCIAGYRCCDCSVLDWVVACIDNENAALAAQYGCECEE